MKRKLVDISPAADLFSPSSDWEKLKPWIEERRRRLNTPRLYEWFEYIYNEMTKYEQKLLEQRQSSGFAEKL